MLLTTYHHKNPQVHFLFHIIDITSETSLHANLELIFPHLIFLPFQVNLHYNLHDNTHNLYLLIHTLQSLLLNHILHLVLKPLHCYLRTLKLLSFREIFFQVVIPTTVPALPRILEYYTADHSRPPTPNFADYPIRHDPRFPILTERFITNNDVLSNTRKKNKT